MSRTEVAALALSLAACTDDFDRRPPDVQSHVARYFVPEMPAHQLDLLFVIDDTTAMAPYQDRLAELPRVTEAILSTLPGGLPDLRIGVTTNGGELRTLPEIAEPYLAIELHPDGAPTTNFTGSLADALAPLLDVDATSSGPNQLLDAAGRALASGFVREDSRLEIITISATDDGSLASPADYASALEAMKTDRLDVLVSGIYPPGSPRLDAFHAAFPGRSSVTSIDRADWPSLWLPPSLPDFKFARFCFPGPLDIDPVAPGDQYDCSMSYWDHEVELAPLPMCGTEEPCWELVEDPQCDDVDNVYYPTLLRLKIRRSEVAHPEVRGQCLVK